MDQRGQHESPIEVRFKKPVRPKGGMRKRVATSGSAAPPGASLEIVRELQRQRHRVKGVVLEAKRLGDAVQEALAVPTNDDHLKLESTFTSQTESAGEVDHSMLRYIEEQMQPGSHIQQAAPELDEEDGLYKTPCHLQSHLVAPAFAAEESAQRWLAGINEVVLGTEAKMEAIDATEAAKWQVADTSAERAAAAAAGGVRTEIPANFNSNYHMHRREFAAAKKVARPGGTKGGQAGRRGKDVAGDASSYAQFKSNERIKRH